MESPIDELILYLRLAQAFKNRMQPSDRDRALVLAGVKACGLRMLPVAGFCRQLILQNNHGHMVRKWDTFDEALDDGDFLHFLRQLNRKLPVERAETLLIDLGFSCDVSRADYADDMSFVAAVMGIDSDWLAENFG